MTEVIISKKSLLALPITFIVLGAVLAIVFYILNREAVEIQGYSLGMIIVGIYYLCKNANYCKKSYLKYDEHHVEGYVHLSKKKYTRIDEELKNVTISNGKRKSIIIENEEGTFLIIYVVNAKEHVTRMNDYKENYSKS